MWRRAQSVDGEVMGEARTPNWVEAHEVHGATWIPAEWMHIRGEGDGRQANRVQNPPSTPEKPDSDGMGMHRDEESSDAMMVGEGGEYR